MNTMLEINNNIDRSDNANQVMRHILANATPVKFEDIQEGDVVIHFVKNYNSDDHVWVGIVKTHTTRDEWYGDERFYSFQRGGIGNWVTFQRNYDKDFGVLISAKWHATEPGHSIYVMK